MPFVKFTRARYTREEFASRDLERVEGSEVLARLANMEAGYSKLHWSDTPVLGVGGTAYRGYDEFEKAIIECMHAMLENGIVGDEVAEFVELAIGDAVFLTTLSLHEGDNI